MCTDCMSIQQKINSPKGRTRIASHAINIAAAMAKYQENYGDIEVYLDENAASMLDTNKLVIDSTGEKWLDRLNRKQVFHRLRPGPTDTEAYKDNKAIRDHTSKGSASGRRNIFILFLASDPTDEARLRLGKEAREIQEQIRLSRHRDIFIFDQRHALRSSDLTQALLDLDPYVVHFAGHGTGPSGLCFEGQDGRSHLVTSSALSALFKEFSHSVKCVVLNACYSAFQCLNLNRIGCIML